MERKMRSEVAANEDFKRNQQRALFAKMLSCELVLNGSKCNNYCTMLGNWNLGDFEISDVRTKFVTIFCCCFPQTEKILDKVCMNFFN